MAALIAAFTDTSASFIISSADLTSTLIFLSDGRTCCCEVYCIVRASNMLIAIRSDAFIISL